MVKRLVLADTETGAFDGEVEQHLKATIAGISAAFINVKTLGAKGDGVTDDYAAIQAAIDFASSGAFGRCRVYIPEGDYRVGSTLRIPAGRWVRLQGAGRPRSYGANRNVGTTILRRTHTGPLIQEALDATRGARPRFDLSEMEIHGGDLGGSPVLDLVHIQESTWMNLRVAHATTTLLRAGEWFNSSIYNTFFQNGGNGRSAPAVLVNAPNVGTAEAESANTVHFIGCEWETNSGTDLKITGLPGGGGPQDWALGVLVTSFKMERNTGDFPLIDLERAGACQFSDGFMHLGPDATGTHVEQKGTAVVPTRPNGFSNVEVSASKWNGVGESGIAAVPYFFDITVGTMLLSNVGMNGSPSTAFVHIGPSVGRDAIRFANVLVNDRSKLIFDERAGSTFTYGHVPLVPVVATPANAVILVNRAVWEAAASGTTTLTFANFVTPSDAASDRPIRIRFYWYADGTGGDVRWTASAIALNVDGGTSGSGQSDYSVTEPVPGTAGSIRVTTIVTTNQVRPGSRLVATRLLRLGNDALDTSTASVKILGAEVLYERAL